jgi:hypothetical protein
VGPAQHILDRWFESDILKTTLATDAVIGMCACVRERVCVCERERERGREEGREDVMRGDKNT